MFDIGSTELLLVAIVALMVVGPKDLPKLLRTVGQWVGKARGTARHFKTGLDTMLREAELEEMQKEWARQNADIMRAHPQVTDQTGEAKPDAPETPETKTPDTPPS